MAEDQRECACASPLFSLFRLCEESLSGCDGGLVLSWWTNMSDVTINKKKKLN